MPITTRVVWHHDEVKALITSPSGPAARDLLRRGNNVRNQALRNLRSMGVGQKTGTGTLAQSIVVELVQSRGNLAVRIGSRLDYARYVHDGHGWIYPKRGQFLRWPGIQNGGSPRRYKGGKTASYVYARKVRPVAGKPFLTEALVAARD